MPPQVRRDNPHFRSASKNDEKSLQKYIRYEVDSLVSEKVKPPLR